MSWTIERNARRPVRRIGDNRLAVPLRLTRIGGDPTDTELTLTLAEAEHLHAALCRALDSQPAPPAAPECRQSVQASPSAAHIVERA
ncbi:hypothetical protein PV379_24315 [Streptomyces caniscabiei]|uniref:hypothetical protein n=1 Tax=Streptomyces caniscabiei TaxID=2746961 RepID=UPI0029AC4034|nr:hypothetical protein [Streptomyces caniscabiei]MDX2601119.1 hypothetical protein [Streptomyces caniscabiei]MDX2739065.1 hypothetical protein [Streptomyces caniscabiei]MDX2780417.1 hypothetical protein [Streptomyces caniscabiei]